MQLLKCATAIALFASSVLAQGISITSPTPGTTVTPGSSVTVTVHKNGHIQRVETISVAIGLQSCPEGSGLHCSTADQGVGTVLYTGPFDTSSSSDQDFTVTIPASTPVGQANLAAAAFYLVGILGIPALGVANASLTVGSA